MLTVTGAALAAACARPPARPPDVILVSIDTLRADHLGCYGYALPTTPNLDAFRRDAVLFSQTIAAAPSTLASHASIMTSLLPGQHGAAHTRHLALAPRFLTLAAIFRQHGYRTVSFNDGGQLAAEFGLANGFDVYRSSDPARPYRFAAIVDQATAELAAAAATTRPLFLFLHTYQVHHPYIPDAADLALMEAPYRGPLTPRKTGLAELIAIRDGRLKIGPRDLQHIVATYDGGIRTMDRAFGQLVAALRRAGRYENALIVVTSDHGEEFGEHGSVGWHAYTLYDELLRVPLLVKLPGALHAGATVATQVRSIDIAPTLVAALRWPRPAQFRGADLLPLLGAPTGAPPPPRFAVSQVDSHPDTSIRVANWKLYDSRLFDLHADPRETRDAAPGHSDVATALDRRRQALLAELPGAAGPPVTLTPEERARLRSLGYLP